VTKYSKNKMRNFYIGIAPLKDNALYQMIIRLYILGGLGVVNKSNDFSVWKKS